MEDNIINGLLFGSAWPPRKITYMSRVMFVVYDNAINITGSMQSMYTFPDGLDIPYYAQAIDHKRAH